MATHHCISMPCWICHPEFAPKVNDTYSEPFKLPELQLSESLKDLLEEVFRQGLDEDAHYFNNRRGLTLDNLKSERANISSDSFEAKLLDLMIEDIEGKGDPF